ncbi:MAG: quinate 5-dehydrogenase [Selenomonadales bacterium]|nr:quinate 5-dehydrogenase [Selenomonadales bacterium]
MKEVVSVSLGSSSRDRRIRLKIGTETVRIVRIGTDGDIRKAKNWIRRLDGRVDAIGLGGIDRYLTIAGRRYPFRQAESLARIATRSPVCDGSLLKNTLERDAVLCLERALGSLKGRRVLLVSATDRYGMAETFDACGAQITCGDLLYGLGLPMPVRKLSVLRRLASWLMPVITRCPIQTLYPVGKEQTVRRPRFTRYFDEADIIAGDLHYIHRYMPDRLDGKIIVTNTTTEEDRAFLKKSGASILVTTTPILGGRSFGTNVMEAVLVALAGSSAPAMHSLYLREAGIAPQLVSLG